MHTGIKRSYKLNTIALSRNDLTGQLVDDILFRGVDMEIRKATIEDVKDISRIHALSWKSAYKGIIPQVYLDELKEDFWVPAFETWIKDNVLTAQLIIKEGSPVGCVAYGKARDKSLKDWGEIVSIYLLHEYFGRGLGNLLLESALLDLKQSGHINVYLWVLKKNQRGRRFYEKHKWQCSKDECVVEIAGKKLIELRYNYSLEK